LGKNKNDKANSAAKKLITTDSLLFLFIIIQDKISKGFANHIKFVKDRKNPKKPEKKTAIESPQL